MKKQIINVNAILPDRILQDAVVAYENEKIVYVGLDQQHDAQKTVDGSGAYLLPGFIDLHCHGGNGLEFMDATADEYAEIANFHLSHGTTTMLATTLAASDQETQNALNTFEVFSKRYPYSTLKGVHMEGRGSTPRNAAHKTWNT